VTEIHLNNIEKSSPSRTIELLVSITTLSLLRCDDELCFTKVSGFWQNLTPTSP
jgi:hypothetical protein